MISIAWNQKTGFFIKWAEMVEELVIIFISSACEDFLYSV